METSSVPVISARAAALYSKCPMRYKLSEIDKAVPQSNGMTVLAECLKLGVRQSLDGAMEHDILETFEENFTTGVSLASYWKTRDLSTFMALGKRFMMAFHNIERPCLDVVEVDAKYTRRVRTNSYNPEIPREPIELSGEVPVVEKTAVGFFRLVGIDPGAQRVRQDIELVLSAIAAHHSNAWILLFNVDKQMIQRRVIMARGGAATMALECARSAAQGIAAGDFRPVDPETPWCIYGSCLWWPRCRGRMATESLESEVQDA